MRKNIYLRKSERIRKYLILLSLIFFLIGGYFFINRGNMKASTVIGESDFNSTVQNKWNDENKKNYAELKWDKVSNADNSAYKLHQSEDGSIWESRSLMYGKEINVLNIYMNEAEADTVQNWLTDLKEFSEEDVDLLKIRSISLSNYNENPDNYLKNTKNDYQYDVIFFSSITGSNGEDLSEDAGIATKSFFDTGRGLLFGNDIVVEKNPVFYAYFSTMLGINSQETAAIGSNEVKLINNDYLMKYPYEIPNDAILTIPYAKEIEIPKTNLGTTWLEFNDGSGAEYLKTNKNVGIIYSSEEPLIDERKLIVNTLYNLAQVSLDNFAVDQTVKDDQAPNVPEIELRYGKDEYINLEVNASDNGKEYQWYIETSSEVNTSKKSNIVKDKIKSNIAGYFYEVTDSPNSNLSELVESYKDSYGRIDPNLFNLYVAPSDDSMDYETNGIFTIQESENSERYLHVVAVDRANNVSVASTRAIKELQEQMKASPQLVDFKIERTKNEAKLVDLKLDSSLNSKMDSLEIRTPKNTVIKNFDKLVLPAKWYSYQNSETTENKSFTFVIKDKNDLTTITNFINELRFSISYPSNDKGNIELIFHEKVYTSWIDSSGGTHYYTFIPTVMNWLEAYNAAKKQTYKGLTGYLTTLTSKEEHNHVYENIAKRSGWLGGSRFIRTNKSKINDEKTISTKLTDYTTSGTNWYWVNGPEAGLVFYDKKKYADGGKAPKGVYQGFNNPVSGGDLAEPNNAGATEETVLEFAQESLSRYWNDLNAENLRYKSGYYVEFSEYGSQKEGIEVTDVSWTAEMPQKVSLKAYDEAGKSLPAGDLLLEQQLRIGKQEIISPTTVEMYEFVKLVSLTGNTISPLEWTITNSFSGGKLIYRQSGLTVHTRQVIMEPNKQVVIPDQGYGLLESKTSLGQLKNETSLTMNSTVDNTGAFDTYIIQHESDEVLYTFEPKIPMNYELLGVVVSTKKQQHLPENSTLMPIDVDVSLASEFWLTTYIKPSTKTPTLHHWNYKSNDLGTITIN